MARVNIPIHKLEDNNKFSAAIKTTDMAIAIDAADGGEIAWDVRDDKAIIIVQNDGDGEAEVTIHHGNGIQGTADLIVAVPAEYLAFVAIDSGRFKNVSGADKGKVIVTTNVEDVKVAVLAHP